MGSEAADSLRSRLLRRGRVPRPAPSLSLSLPASPWDATCGSALWPRGRSASRAQACAWPPWRLRVCELALRPCSPPLPLQPSPRPPLPRPPEGNVAPPRPPHTPCLPRPRGAESTRNVWPPPGLQDPSGTWPHAQNGCCCRPCACRGVLMAGRLHSHPAACGTS